MADVSSRRDSVIALPTGAAIAADAAATLRVAIRPQPPASRFVLRGAGLPARAAGFALDQPVNRATGLDGERLAARLGPDEWLLIAPVAGLEAIAHRLAADLSSTWHSAVEVSHRNLAIEIAGPEAVSVLNAGCPLDLAPAAFPVGMATRTLVGKAEIVMVRTAAQSFRLEVWRSFARYVHALLEDAALEFRAG